MSDAQFIIQLLLVIGCSIALLITSGEAFASQKPLLGIIAVILMFFLPISFTPVFNSLSDIRLQLLHIEEVLNRNGFPITLRTDYSSNEEWVFQKAHEARLRPTIPLAAPQNTPHAPINPAPQANAPFSGTILIEQGLVTFENGKIVSVSTANNE